MHEPEQQSHPSTGIVTATATHQETHSHAGLAKLTVACTSVSDWRTDPAKLRDATARLAPPLSGGMREYLVVDRTRQMVDVCGNVHEMKSDSSGSSTPSNLAAPCRPWWERLKKALNLQDRNISEPPLCKGPVKMLDPKSGELLTRTSVAVTVVVVAAVLIVVGGGGGRGRSTVFTL